MQCYIYKSLKKNELYLYIEKKDDFSTVPEHLLKSFGRLEFVMELTLSSELKLAKEKVGNVLNSIKSKGFFVQIPPTTIPDPLTAKNNKLH